MTTPTTALGIISGTSMDGIDVACVVTDGERVIKRGPGATFAYPDDVRRDLIALVQDPQRAEHGPIGDIEARVTDAHVAAVTQYLERYRTQIDAVDVLGFHGQTIIHRPERRFTRQLFDGAMAAQHLGIDVVCRFRDADVAAGGQGAPLVPLYHRALVRGAQLAEPIMVLNLGGVGNVTYIDGDTVIAFDTGPASALIDDWVRRHSNADYDAGGSIAASGRIDQAHLARLLGDPYFSTPAPKSLDRNHFHRLAGTVSGLSLADGAATLTAFTVAATAMAVRLVPRRPLRWLVAGGGRLNTTIMRGLADTLQVPVESVDALGWDGDQIEAECFGFLAARSLKGLPLSLPATTGVPYPMPGGVLFRA